MTVTYQPLAVGFAYVLFGLIAGLARSPKCTVITCLVSFLLSIWLVSFLSLQIYAERERVCFLLANVYFMYSVDKNYMANEGQWLNKWVLGDTGLFHPNST